MTWLVRVCTAQLFVIPNLAILLTLEKTQYKEQWQNCFLEESVNGSNCIIVISVACSFLRRHTVPTLICSLY